MADQEVPPRPARNAPEVRAKAVEEIAAQCAEWGGGTSDEWAVMLSRCHLTDNGYELARELDTYHRLRGIDAELVEILDSASSYLWSAHDDAVAEWVAANGIKPALPVGTRVSIPRGEGVIRGFDDKHGSYLVIPDGEEELFKNGGGNIVAYELAQQVSA